MNINKYCEKCDRVWKKDIRYCEICGQSVQAIQFNNNKINTGNSEESLGDIGKKLGGKVVSGVISTTINAKKAYEDYSKQRQTTKQSIQNHSPIPRDKNYRELLMVCNSIKSIGRLIMGISKGFFYLLLTIGALVFVTNISKGIQIALAGLIIPFIFGFIICLPIYIAGLVMTAVPQIINLIHDIRDNVVEINKKTPQTT